MDEQARLTDLIPRRLTTFALLLLAGLLVVAGLEVLYAWMPRLAPATSDGGVAALDLDGEGSLAVWFSSMTLAMAAVVSVIVYSVRRYKNDDYSGYYRVWLWAALCWLVMSVDETASLHEGFKEMMVMLTGTRLIGDGSMWWVIAYFFLLGPIGTRLLVDMRHCRLSTAVLIMAAGCYGLGVVTQLGWVMPESGARGIMLEEGAEMLGNLLLLLAMGLHARYVILDAEGLLPLRARDEDVWDNEEEEDGLVNRRRDAALRAKAGSVTVHPPHGMSRPAYASAQARSSLPTAAEAEASVGRKLTKQEKKALRRRLEKMRRQREGR